MIQKFTKLWKVEGMDYSDNSNLDKVTFDLLYENKIIGSLCYERKIWKFEYSEYFKKNYSLPFLIIDFPNVNQIYEQEQLWPFFASRIPTINQPYQLKKIKKANIDKEDAVSLLKLFGKNTINNPFRLQVVQ